MNTKPLYLKQILNFIKKRKSVINKIEVINLLDAEDKILAENIYSKINLPPFKNSAVDGYALLKKDLNKTPKKINQNRVAAGDAASHKIKDGEVIRIFTGAKMPSNSDTVVMQENTEISDNKLSLLKVPVYGDNCRHKGEDIHKGSLVLKKGTKIDTKNLNLISAIGYSKIKVYVKIKIGFYTSGNELVKPTTKLKNSKINNSNFYLLNSLLNKNYITKKFLGNLPDNANKINTIDNMFFFKKDTNENIKGTGFEGISFLQNDMPGRSGETFKTSTIQRSLVFYIFALGMLAGTQRMSAISSQNGGLLKIGIKKSRIKGLIKALKGEELPANAVESEKHAYEEAIERIDLVRSKIITRQDYILRCIAIINDKVDALDATYKALINYSQGTTAGASFPFVKAKLDENNFFDDTFSLLNASHKDYFSNSFLRNFCMSNNVRYSYFLESDTFHINDLKIMYKLFSQPGYGFLKNEKLGRKNIYHIGMPLGLLEYLRREAYKETGDEDYLDSSLITISVYKNNQLSTETKYLPKQFVFDASKHVLPFYCNHLGNTRYSRHVSRMTDDLSLKKIIENIEMYVFNEGLNFGFKSNGYGSKGIVGNKTSDLSNNYENDDQFAKDVAMNQISDYYLKLYTNLTTSIEINESMFPVDSNKSFTGNLDNSKANEFKNSIIQKILLAHPKITETEFQSERFFRAANSLNNSILLSSKNRLTEMLSVGCFERVFSILINERDFLIDDDNVNDIYKDSPSVNITSKIQRTQVNPFYVSRIKSNTIKNYLREINDKHTSMSGFSIDIGLLKKW